MKHLVLTTASKPSYEPEKVVDIEVNDGKAWYNDVQNFLDHGEFPIGAYKKDKIII